MADTILWIIGLLAVGFIAWNWFVVPYYINAIGMAGTTLKNNPKLAAQLKKQVTHDFTPHPTTASHYGYYYYG